jgi:hypothetical protein
METSLAHEGNLVVHNRRVTILWCHHKIVTPGGGLRAGGDSPQFPREALSIRRPTPLSMSSARNRSIHIYNNIINIFPA